VVIVLALAYVGWRSSRATGYSSYATQPAPSAAEHPTQPTPTPVPPKVDAAEHSTNAQATDAGGADKSKPVAKPNIETSNNDRPSVERVSAARSITHPPIAPASNANPASTPTTESQTPTIGGSGYEELAMAKRYLNGSAGQQNSAEAVDWLWKAVAKRNTDATLLLSEMFMRGNGIPKNCDQARVLLDAAASRGVKDAAVRLRNMQAFGCQ
jgi:TPR repeat protein